MLPDDQAISLGVSEFVALTNQTFEYAFNGVIITGELANLRVSKGKWLYFDLKDEGATVKFFGTVYMLPGPLEDGMIVKVRGTPRLHHLYGFSVTVQSIQPAGEGSIRKAADLLLAQLTKEGLFEESRKRSLPYPPRTIGLVASKQSAAYADFTKILNARWAGLDIQLIDVQVQGEIAPSQIIAAIKQFNAEAAPPEVLVLIRGGGSSEDLAAFSTEQVTRAVAASRVPTLVAIGHEVDLSLAELAADVRASTPSNAAELLVPDKQTERRGLGETRNQLGQLLSYQVERKLDELNQSAKDLHAAWVALFDDQARQLKLKQQLLQAYNPSVALKRGYAIIRTESSLITSVKSLKPDQAIDVQLADGSAIATITAVRPNKGK
jgi:exodeoxyribonuclease VII large subunit